MGPKPTAQKAMTPTTRAFIMWILLLQACHTCAGNSIMLSKFEAMLNMMVAKNTNIYQTEAPAVLILSAKLPKKCPAGDLDGDGGSTKHPRMAPNNPSNKVHPKIKTSFVGSVLKQVPNIMLYNICRFCNTTASALLPDAKRCSLYMMGLCHHKCCKCKHETASDAKAEHVLTLLEKAVRNPEDLKADQA
eukprot:14392688-Ditylum_brightwellii.AAC.1